MKRSIARLSTAAVVAVGLIALLATTVIAQGSGSTEGEESTSDARPTSQVDLETDTFLGDREFISGRAFHGQSSTAVYSYSNDGCISVDNTDRVTSEVDLPHGAQINSVTLHFYDDDGASDAQGFLFRYETSNTTSGTSPTFDTVYTINTADGDDSGYQSLTDNTADPSGANVIDHSTYTYALVFAGGGSSPDLCGFNIFYTYGDSDALTFHQTEPCAAFDTRAGQGGREAPLNSQEEVTFDLIRSDYSSQGGTSDTSGCSLPSGTSGSLFGNPNGTVAVLVNLVALNPESGGNLKVWDNDDTEPNGGVVVFDLGENNSNAIAIGVDDGSAFGGNGGEIVVKNNAGQPVDVRGVILGYYTTPPKNQE